MRAARNLLGLGWVLLLDGRCLPPQTDYLRGIELVVVRERVIGAGPTSMRTATRRA
jgi:hypothetical protein